MHPEFTNLLPEERASAARTSYWLRLATLATYCALAVIVLNALLLAPSYLLAKEQTAARENELATLEAAAASTGAGSFASEIATYAARATALVKLGASRPDVPILASILGIPHAGVSLTGFSFSANHQVVITGVATTRDALRAYDLALSGAPFVASVSLPVSAYAAESDLSFTMTIVLVSP